MADPEANLGVRFVRNGSRISISGDLESDIIYPQFNTLLAETLDDADVDVVSLDVSDLTYINSRGLHMFLVARSMVADKAKELELHNLSAINGRLFDLTGTRNLFTIVQDSPELEA